MKPAFTLSKRECARIILRHDDCPINPAWLWNHFTDCGCLSKGDPSELDKVEERFPWFGQRLREYEEAAEGGTDDGLRTILGWDGLAAPEKKAQERGQVQMTLCGDGCQREQDPTTVAAFRAVARGAPREDGIRILDGDISPEGRTWDIDTILQEDDVPGAWRDD